MKPLVAPLQKLKKHLPNAISMLNSQSIIFLIVMETMFGQKRKTVKQRKLKKKFVLFVELVDAAVVVAELLRQIVANTTQKPFVVAVNMKILLANVLKEDVVVEAVDVVDLDSKIVKMLINLLRRLLMKMF